MTTPSPPPPFPPSFSQPDDHPVYTTFSPRIQDFPYWGYVLNFTFFGIVEKSRNEPIRPWAARNHPYGTTSLLPLVMSQFVVPSHTFSLKLFPSPWGKKSEKKRGGREKSQSRDCFVTFKPQILPINARTSQANILLLDQKAAKCAIRKLLGGSSTGQLFQREDSDYDKPLILFFLLITDGNLLQYSFLQHLITHN